MSITDKLLDLLFPDSFVCCICQRETRIDERAICADCRERLSPPSLPCGAELGSLAALSAAWAYDDVTSPAIHALKYQNKRYLAPKLAGSITIPEQWQLDALIPVPLYPAKQQGRGYNQSELIASALSQRYSIELLADCLKRIRDTGTQTALSAAQREQNVAGAFAVDKCALAMLKGRRVALVDDVFTTGSTMRECARVLADCGAEAVYALCVCVRR